MTTTDLRYRAWSAHGPAGGSRTITQTWLDGDGAAADISAGVSAWLGGSLADVDDFTGATEIEATLDDNVAELVLPFGLVDQALRLTLGGDVLTVGTAYPSEQGTDSTDDGLTVTLGDALEMTIELVGGGGSGTGLPTGGTTGQALRKISDTDGDADWDTLTATDVGADPAGSAATALTAAGDYVDAELADHVAALDPHVQYLTEVAAAGTYALLAEPIAAAEAARALAAEALLIPLTQKAANNGVATLDGSGLIPAAQLPSIAVSDVFVVASQAAMLALTAQRGDVAIRSDLNKSYVLATESPGTLADWKELLTPTDAVLAVAGLTGTITAAALRTALTLVVGTDVQAFNANLAALAGLTGAADKGIRFTAAGALATHDLTSFGRSLVGTSNLAALQAILGTGTPSSSTFLRGDGSWATPAGGGVTPFLGSGNWGIPNVSIQTPNNATGGNGTRTMGMACKVDAPITVTTLGARVNTTAASGNFRIGLASLTNAALLSSIIADSGTISTATSGIKSYTLPTPVLIPAGWYMRLFQFDGNGTPNWYNAAEYSGHGNLADIGGTVAWVEIWENTGTAYGAFTTATVLSNRGGGGPANGICPTIAMKWT